ncbi:MAG: acetate--CoA ligase [Firmicutes bacterium]|nr:acetate--CoA ligase [Bacillota bacterium]
MERFFNPKSVAVVGASSTRGKVGNSVLVNLIECGFKGKIIPINPKADQIEGLTAYPNVTAAVQDVGSIDLVIVTVPARAVLAVAQECARQKIKNLIVITAGFKEVGKAGAELERQLVEIARTSGMNLLGPNCLGMMDTHTPINASFAQDFPEPGEIAFISQSGALGTAVLDWAISQKIGLSKFVSLGNKAGLNEADFIEAAAQDPNTKVILCYIENVVDGPRFMEVARKASARKPVIIFKAGTSEAGARAASSHTGALAGNDRTYETVFKQSGVLRVRRMEDLFSLALVFLSQPLPRGNRVTIVTNAGGPGIIAADAVESLGLEMSRFTKETIESMRPLLPAESNLLNPVDVIGDAKADRYKIALEHVAEDPNVDGIVVLLTPQAVTEPKETAETILEVHKKAPDKPIVAAFMGGKSVAEGASLLRSAGIPCYSFAEPAVEAFSYLSTYARLRERQGHKPLPELEVERDRINEIISEAAADRRHILFGSEGAEILTLMGVNSAPTKLAKSAEEAVEIAKEIGFPVVMKLAAPKVLHKTDLGGVKLNIKTESEVFQAFHEIIENLHYHLPGTQAYGVEVQKMDRPGRECIIGMTRDLQFGPLLMFGLGGIYVNLLKDVSFRVVHGLDLADLHEMVQETKAYKLLKGIRGEKPGDINAIVDTLAKVAILSRDFPQINEIDINPLFVWEDGVSAVDIKITLREVGKA